MTEVTYNDKPPYVAHLKCEAVAFFVLLLLLLSALRRWDILAGGFGSSLEIVCVNEDPKQPSNWRASPMIVNPVCWRLFGFVESAKHF